MKVKKEKRKFISLEELKDLQLGKPGTPARDKFEQELKEQNKAQVITKRV